MERIFLKDIGKNFKKGDVKDYPRSTWEQIEKSAGEKLADFSNLTNDFIKNSFDHKRQPQGQQVSNKRS